jgi:hypothetical protein
MGGSLSSSSDQGDRIGSSSSSSLAATASPSPSQVAGEEELGGRMRLERGPIVSLSRYIEERLSKVTGKTPDEALQVSVPYTDKHGLQRRYKFGDLVFDLKRGHLVIPYLERSPVPDGVVRGASIKMTDRESTFSALVASRYWSIKDGEAKSQKPLPSAFVVSVLSIIKHVYGAEEMARVKEDPVGFAWEGDMGGRGTPGGNAAVAGRAGWEEGMRRRRHVRWPMLRRD